MHGEWGGDRGRTDVVRKARFKTVRRRKCTELDGSDRWKKDTPLRLSPSECRKRKFDDDEGLLI